MILLLLACTPSCMEGFGADADGNCLPLARPGQGREPSQDSALDSGGTGDTGDSAASEFLFGDPITVVATSFHQQYEFLDAEVLDEHRGVVVGQAGLAIVSLDDGSMLFEGFAERGYRIAVDGDQAYVTTRTGRMYKANVGDSPSVGSTHMLNEWTEDIAADDGLVLLAALDQGAIVMDGASNLYRSIIPGDRVQGVALLDGTALVADDDELSLYDLSDPTSPVLLDSADLRGTAWDLAFDGQVVAVALGARGVDLFRVEGDALVPFGDLPLPGSAAGVALDGEWLWIGAWDVTALAWVGAGGPYVVGHESFKGAAMGISGGHGKALVPAWQNLPVLERHDLMGPEVHTPRALTASTEPISFELRNWGALDLELSLEAPLYTVEPEEAVLAPGEETWVTLSGGGSPSTLTVTTNDPDEAWVYVPITVGDSVGEQHPVFELTGFELPDTEVGVVSLDDFEGRPVLLAYWALF